MKIGLVGYQGSGKSTLFHWLTGVAPDPAMAHTGQSAMAPIPDVRFEPLCKIYHPKKVTHAAIELVDTPGLSRRHEGNATRMAMIREAGCLVFVVAGFDNTNPVADLRSFDEDLVLADMEIVTNRIARVEEQLKKPLPRLEHQQLEHEHGTLKIVLAAMESGRPLRESHMTDEQQKVTRAFRLFTEKPRLVIVNTADDESQPERFTSLSTPEQPGTLEDEPDRSGRFRRRDGHHHHRPRPSDPHALEVLAANDLLHSRRARGSHVALARRGHGAGGGRRHPHRSRPGVHPRRSDDRHRSGAIRQ